MPIDLTKHNLTPYLTKLSQVLETEYDFPGPDATRVLDYLYLGNEQNAVDKTLQKDLGITHVINCCESDCRKSYAIPKTIKYMGFSAKDDLTYDIMQHFEAVQTFIEDARKSGGKVLIHCVYGSNRSGALVVGYLMVQKKLGPISAAMYVKERRGVVLTNDKFQEQVVKFALGRNLLEIDVAMKCKFLNYALPKCIYHIYHLLHLQLAQNAVTCVSMVKLSH